MRVLHVLNSLRPSGAEVMLCSSHAEWRKQGVEGEILATGPTLGNFASTLKDAGYPIHHLPRSRSLRHFLAVRRLIVSGRYDVVHVHLERASFWYLVSALTVRDIGVMRTIHTVFAFPGLLRLQRLIQRNLVRIAGVQTISVGSTVRDNELRRFRNPTTWVPNWVDTTKFSPPSEQQRAEARASFGLDGHRPLVLSSVANCNATKNHEAIIRALAELSEDVDWLYLHAGETRADGQEERLADELGITDRCRFLGFVPDVVELLHASDIYLMPSLQEGVGNSALEAVATGVTSVLANSPGLVELRKTVDEGIVWVDTSPDGVRRGIEAATGLSSNDDRGRRARMHASVRHNYGVEAGVEGYLEVYATARR